MKKICRLSLVSLSLVLACVMALPMTVSAEMVKKVDNFIVSVDQSGSMAQSGNVNGNQKYDQAVNAVSRFDSAVPELGYNSAVSLVAPYKALSKPATYQNGALASAVTGVAPAFNQLTTLGDGLMGNDKALSGLSGKTAMILFTDGESNAGYDAVAAAKSLYGKHGDNLCVHVVSYADTKAGQQTIDAIKALSGCSVVADAKSLDSDAAMAQFAKAVLYDEVAPKPAPAPAPVVQPAPAPAPAPVAKEVITFNLLFGFDKHQITDEMIPVLEQAKAILMEDASASFTVSGHADSTGPDDYNQKLSERRANSVKNWLVNNGVAEYRLDAKGYGESSPKYDNSTREGRKLNRRVEIQTK